MGYELHIIRQRDYEDSEEESNISLEEWLAYVATDEELELTNGYEMNIPGIETTWQNRPGFCNWVGHPRSDATAIPWLDFGHGCISAKYPDSDTIKKMIKISIALNAKVCGDDSEYYDETYFTNGGYSIPQLSEISTDKSVKNNLKKPWWKFW